ncbi:hypothetical protein CY35_16G012500 [Sphagnum magellanicum]|nr:hypothetical protein CY35_16G012500 [Sphagnum magellanicum]
MGSGSSRSALDERAAVRRERDAVMVAAAYSLDRRPSFRRNNPERLNLEEIMQPGRRSASNQDMLWTGEGSTSSRGLGWSAPEPSSDIAEGGSDNSSSQSSLPSHGRLDGTSLPAGGDDTTHHMESEASGSSSAGVSSQAQQHSSVYVQTTRMASSSSGIHDEEVEGSRQPLYDERLHHACETMLRRHQVNEMQERLRHYAGLPSFVDLRDLEGGGFMLSDSSHSYRRVEVVAGAVNQGLFSSASSDRDANSSSTWPAPSLLQSWDQLDAWEGSFLGGQSSAGPTSVHTSPSTGESSGLLAPETRRSSGRRLWDALSRATFHRRTSIQTMAALADLEEISIPLGDVGQIVDAEAFHGSRSLDLEERRRHVRSQVWALRHLSNGLGGTSWHSRSCAGRHHGHRCACEAHDVSDETDTRASISRIIMLAEALFEVLDEIHRQSVALSESTNGSVTSRPAPSSVVDGMPLRVYGKGVDACDEAPQSKVFTNERTGMWRPIVVIP